MSFLNAMTLFGLALAIMPLAIHLLINRKKTVIRWAAYEWMLKAKQKRRKKNKVDEILKIVAKTLLLVVLVLLMARPAILSGKGGERLLVIDSTLSMGAIVDERTRLEKAKEMAKAIIDSSGPPAGIYVFDGALKPLAKAKVPVRAAKALVDGIELSPTPGSFQDLTAALPDAQAFKEADAVSFISDFQKTQYQDSAATAQAVKRLSGKRLELIPVDSRANLRNISIDSFSPPPEGFIPGKANRVVVKVTNHSPLPADAVPITISVNGERKDRASVSLPPNSSGFATLSLSLPSDEESRIRVEAPPDCLPEDNALCVVASPKSGPNILAVVKDRGDASFAHDVFLRNAIMSFMGGARVKYKSIPPQRVFEENLDNYDVLISFGIPFSERNGTTDAIMGFLRKGRPLIAFSDLSADGYWKDFGVESGPASGGASAQLDPSRLENGYLEFMKGAGLDPSLVSFAKFAPISLKGIKGAEGRIYLAGVKDPIAASFRKDGGSVALFGFMPTTGYTNLFYNPNFVQFAMRALADATGKDAFACFIGDQVKDIPLPQGIADGSFSLVSEDGRSEPAELRRLGSGASSLSAASPVDNGFRAVRRDAETLMTIGCNATRLESDVEPATPAMFKEAAQAGAVYCDTPTTQKGGKAASELPFLMIFLLLAAIAFDAYAHFLRRAKA